ncbi:MAG TPA: HIT domain-containing protein [Spirochaetota bacterium]|nr:HIT domain-containing protein [Spirochaetota bacterium]
MRDHLFNTDKIAYVKGARPDVSCILCAIAAGDPRLEILEVLRTGLCMVSINLYPFNTGHLLVFPLRHVEDYTGLSDGEALEVHRLTSLMISAVKEEFSPAGFNLGWNLGCASGASIAHLHQHIVPRYENELGFLDVLAGTRVVVVDPRDALGRLKKRILEIGGPV